MPKNVSHIIHLHSNNVDAQGQRTSPTTPQLEHGEIAINYKSNNETIFVKNDNDEIVPFSSDAVYTSNKLGSAFTNSNQTVTDALNAISSVTSTYYSVVLAQNGSVSTYDDALIYSDIKPHVTDANYIDHLDVVWEYDTNLIERFIVPLIGIDNINGDNGNITFASTFLHGHQKIMITFNLNPSDVLTTTSLIQLEETNNKVNSIINSPNQITYPTTYAVYNEFVRKPVTVWETDGTSGLLGVNDGTVNLNSWQLENLEFTPFKYVIAYIKQANRNFSTTQANYVTPSVMVNIPLDAASLSTGYTAYIGGVNVTNPNDRNVHFCVLCAIDATKTKFKVVSEHSIYGTALGGRNDNGRYCYKIVGYYD